MEIEGIRVVHALPGRVRLKVDRVKGNPPLAREAREKLAKVPGIRQVEAKSDTGSLLIHYDTEKLFALTSLEVLSTTLGEIFPEIEVVTLAAWLSSLAEDSGPAARTDAASGISGALAGFNPGVLDLRLLIPFTLVLFGGRALLASEEVIFPAWYDYLWFGFSTFVMLNRGLVEGQSAAGASPAAAS
ncbi:MAG: HMA2 domain-containing protein [Desulfobaccales bacterium]